VAISYERATPVHVDEEEGQAHLMTWDLYRGTSLIRKRLLLGPYSRHMPRALWWSLGGGAVSHERGTPVSTGQVASHNPPLLRSFAIPLFITLTCKTLNIV